jgi:hypothetical protein
MMTVFVRLIQTYFVFLLATTPLGNKITTKNMLGEQQLTCVHLLVPLFEKSNYTMHQLF